LPYMNTIKKRLSPPFSLNRIPMAKPGSNSPAAATNKCCGMVFAFTDCSGEQFTQDCLSFWYDGNSWVVCAKLLKNGEYVVAELHQLLPEQFQ